MKKVSTFIFSLIVLSLFVFSENPVPTDHEAKYFENFTINFAGYDIDSHQMSEGELHIPAILNLSDSENQFVIKPAMKIVNNEKIDLPVKLPGSERKVFIKVGY